MLACARMFDVGRRERERERWKTDQGLSILESRREYETTIAIRTEATPATVEHRRLETTMS